MTKANRWYGFCLEGNKYYAFEKNCLPNHFLKMTVGQTLPMLCNDELWDAHCIAISNKESVEQMIDNMNNENSTHASLTPRSPMDDKKKTEKTAKTLKRILNSASTSESENPMKKKAEEKVDGEEIEFTISGSNSVATTSMSEERKEKYEQKDGDEDHESFSGGIDGEKVIDSSPLIVKDDEETIFTELEVSRFREADSQLTRTEEEFKELKMLMQSKFNEAHNKLIQARLHHQQCLLAMTEEQKKEELDD